MKSAVVTREATKQELKQAFRPQPEAMVKHEFNYRGIAKMFASALQVEGESFTEHTERFLSEIKALSTESKRALQFAYIFSRKVPAQERFDFMQELAITLLERRPNNDSLAYAIANCDWRDWWKAYKMKSHYNTDSIEHIAESENTSDYGANAAMRQVYHSALLQGEIEFERKVDIDILWSKLPERIQRIISKQIVGNLPTHAERQALYSYIKTHSTMLAEFK